MLSPQYSAENIKLPASTLLLFAVANQGALSVRLRGKYADIYVSIK